MENKTIYSAFAAAAEQHKNHAAVIYLGTQFTYRKLKNLSERFAVALTDMGLTSGQRVIMYIPNSIQWVISWLACQKIGAVCVPITPIYTPHDLNYIANDSDAETIICADTNFGYVTTVLPETRLKRVIVTNVADLLPSWVVYQPVPLFVAEPVRVVALVHEERLQAPQNGSVTEAITPTAPLPSA